MIPRPDAEAAWVAWLHRGGFSKAATRLPEEHVDQMMRVSRVGGKRLNIVQDEAQMLIEVWCMSAYQASELAHKAADRIEAAAEGTMLTEQVQAKQVSTTGPLEFPDPNSHLYRYQFTFSCTLRRFR